MTRWVECPRADLDRVIDQAFADPYPPELDDKGGRIAWRKQHLLDLLDKEFG